ncbi:UNVERIFIED_CONTAM: hypothetical protein Sangu_0832800 [Sesamum angustifolium]|uniref:Retrotransposon gag domain-containing protein n=1 Tax=Sesamum angustifolium TaxID=2727405 RepID=A0AAW2PWH8_9LAMI
MADELFANCRTPAIAEYDDTTDPQEYLSCFENAALLHSSQKLQKTELSLFAIRQKNNESLKEYLQRFNIVALKVSFATQEVKASAFSQGLLDRDFFKSIAKKPVSKFGALVARTAKYINMDDAQAAKKESRGEKRKETKEGLKVGSGDRVEPSGLPRKGVIQMIVGDPVGVDSHHVRKTEVRKADEVTIKEVLDVEAIDDTPLIQFGRAERSGPKNSHNDTLVITTMLSNYEVGRIFINSGSSVDILFGKAYDQMQLGDIPLERVDTSLYSFIGEVVHPRGMISLPLTLETGPTR